MGDPTGESAARRALLAATQQLDRAGLNHNSAGNLGVRVGERVLVTPSGVAPASMTTDGLVLLEPDGTPAGDGQPIPTSEWRLHTTVLRRRPDVGAIVHTHSVEATAAATVGASLPAIHYVAARFGTRTLRCAPYATYGSATLADHVADTLADDGMACLMANHGALALGADLERAVALAADVEWFCAISRRSAHHGRPVVLDDAELVRVAERFRSYGQR